jgi:phosphatidylserine/phosphatidylglycerophosphate/cardiolipin synthase-like enzyme
MLRWFVISLMLAGSPAVWALQDAAMTRALPAVGTIQVAFTPGDDAAGLIIQAIGQARQRIRVQAFSFTHRGIAEALIAARKRGVDVEVIVDPQQAARIPTSVVDTMANAGVPVFYDAEHASAHNKIMVIDADTAPVVITGSYNFTHAAQYKNAENLLVVRGNPALARAYGNNWQRHRDHSTASPPRP